MRRRAGRVQERETPWLSALRPERRGLSEGTSIDGFDSNARRVFEILVVSFLVGASAGTASFVQFQPCSNKNGPM